MILVDYFCQFICLVILLRSSSISVRRLNEEQGKGFKIHIEGFVLLIKCKVPLDQTKRSIGLRDK